MSKLRVGLIGCGHIAATHVRAWRRCRIAEVTAVHDLNEEAAKVFAHRFGIARVCMKFADVLAEVDVVDDCSPPSAHLTNALAALGAGRDYLVEKPIVVSTRELDQILEAQRESGRRVEVIHNLKFNNGVQTARRWVREGRIGDVRSLKLDFLTHPSADRMLRMANHWSMRLPGGRWMETLPHDLYLTYDFVGPLTATGVTMLRTGALPPGRTADELLVTLQNSSVLATFHFSARCRTNYRAMVLHGSDGTIRVDFLAGSAAILSPRRGRWARGVGIDALDALNTLAQAIPERVVELRNRLVGDSPHTRMISAFARSVLEGGPLPVTVEEIAYVVQTSDDISRHIAAEEDGLVE